MIPVIDLIRQNKDLNEGLHYGKPRPGHPEGQVINHVKEVLENI